MEDTIKLPLDADGAPIRPGEEVYVKYVKAAQSPRKVRALYYRTAISSWTVGLSVFGTDTDAYYLPADLTHIKPDELGTIEASIRELIELSEEDALSEIPGLMERIKRMVER